MSAVGGIFGQGEQLGESVGNGIRSHIILGA
jgi:hypothetical protein